MKEIAVFKRVKFTGSGKFARMEAFLGSTPFQALCRRAIPLLVTGFCMAGPVCFAQDAFPVKLNNCSAANFCSDCGDVKTGYDRIAMGQQLQRIIQKHDITGIKTITRFQLLVDSTGTGCVMAHSDVASAKITKDLIALFNSTKWKPATIGGKGVGFVVVPFVVSIKEGAISAQIERVPVRVEKPPVAPPPAKVAVDTEEEDEDEEL